MLVSQRIPPHTAAKVKAYIGGDLGCHKLVPVLSQVKVEMGEEVRFTSLDLANNQILVSGVTDVTPHGKVLHKHFKEIVVVDCFLERGQIVGGKSFLTEESPFDTVSIGNFVGR